MRLSFVEETDLDTRIRTLQRTLVSTFDGIKTNLMGSFLDSLKVAHLAEARLEVYSKDLPSLGLY